MVDGGHLPPEGGWDKEKGECDLSREQGGGWWGGGGGRRLTKAQNDSRRVTQGTGASVSAPLPPLSLQQA
ncbi:hypothetical protein CesoFtcFv8_008761 [Champsocephalus esox]|uniref:Uncharacterized protein n=1 Tax=Champsocephalus esox TaxID=159716 RepID=A0AAN8CB80_9TELE|nr:hypothetical protein CesoFtcFv8_008761 [Champsocephalus esox]